MTDPLTVDSKQDLEAWMDLRAFSDSTVGTGRENAAAWKMIVRLMVRATDDQIADTERLLRSWNWDVSIARSSRSDELVATMNIHSSYLIDRDSYWAEHAADMNADLLFALRDNGAQPEVVGVEIRKIT